MPLPLKGKSHQTDAHRLNRLEVVFVGRTLAEITPEICASLYNLRVPGPTPQRSTVV